MHRIKVSCSNVMFEPSHKSELHTQLFLNDSVEVVSKNTNWSEIKLNEKSGRTYFLLTSHLEELEEEKQYDHIIVKNFVDNDLGHIAKGTFFPYEIQTYTERLKAIEWSDYRIKRIISSYLNTPYMWGGCTHFGIDCSGLSKILFRHYGIDLPHYASEQMEFGKVLDFFQDIRCGDLAFFENQEGEINHVGILLNDGYIMHASETNGKVSIDLIDQEGILSMQDGKRMSKLRIIKRLKES